MIYGSLVQDVAKSLREFIVIGFETYTWPFAGFFNLRYTFQLSSIGTINGHNNSSENIRNLKE